MQGCGMNTIKYLLFFFNLIFSISGIILIVVGIIVLVNSSHLNQYADGSMIATAAILIVTGLIIFFVAFLGCWGAIKESSMLLIAFGVALIVIFIIEFAIGIASAVLKESLNDTMNKALKDSLKEYSKEETQKTWDIIQRELKCCGADASSDWDTIIEGGNYPKSCCEKAEPCTAENSYKESCSVVMTAKLRDSSKLLIGIGIGIAFVEVAGVILACCLASALKKQK